MEERYQPHILWKSFLGRQKRWFKGPRRGTCFRWQETVRKSSRPQCRIKKTVNRPHFRIKKTVWDKFRKIKQGYPALSQGERFGFLSIFYWKTLENLNRSEIMQCVIRMHLYMHTCTQTSASCQELDYRTRLNAWRIVRELGQYMASCSSYLLLSTVLLFTTLTPWKFHVTI